MNMKVYVEGMRSLLYYTGNLFDQIKVTESEAEKVKYNSMIDLLTPVCKGYITDRSFEVCSQGVQVYGGYGFIREYPQEQLMRDCRITMIYEGTNGIQAMDLLGRKLGLNQGKAIMDLMGEIQKTIVNAKKSKTVKAMADKLEATLAKSGEVAMHIGTLAMSPKVLTAFAFAHPFMEVFGDVMMAWMLLWRATIAAVKLEKGTKKKDQAFYEGQLKSAEYFIFNILPITLGKMEAILGSNSAAVEVSEDSFGGK